MRLVGVRLTEKPHVQPFTPAPQGEDSSVCIPLRGETGQKSLRRVQNSTSVLIQTSGGALFPSWFSRTVNLVECYMHLCLDSVRLGSPDLFICWEPTEVGFSTFCVDPHTIHSFKKLVWLGGLAGGVRLQALAAGGQRDREPEPVARAFGFPSGPLGSCQAGCENRAPPPKWCLFFRLPEATPKRKSDCLVVT